MKIFGSTSQFIFSSQIVYFATHKILSGNLLEDTERNVITVRASLDGTIRTDDGRVGTLAKIEFSLIKCSLGRDLTVD